MINAWSHTPQHMTFQKTIFPHPSMCTYNIYVYTKTENGFQNVVIKSMENFVSKTKANGKEKKIQQQSAHDTKYI